MNKLNTALQQKLNQGPVMTPQLQQAIALLAMPVQNVQAFVAQEMLENPFLTSEDSLQEQEGLTDVDDLQPSDSASALEDQEMHTEALDTEWDNLYDSGQQGATVSSGTHNAGEVLEATASKQETLQDILHAQLGMSVHEAGDLFLGRYLIDAIAEDGYLRLDLNATAKHLGVTREHLRRILATIQTFEPAGVGARTLAECLELQLVAQNSLTPAATTVLAHLDLLARRDVTALARKAKVTPVHMQGVVDRIIHLNPKPGLKYATGNSQTMIPDVIVVQKDGQWQAELNAEALPQVLLNKTAQGLFSGANQEAQQYIHDRVNRASWLVKSLEQRARTILKVSRAIVFAQADFFEFGVESLKPMTLRQVAEDVGVHESTVSRVTSGKFMQTPLGTFELKHFFSAGIHTTGGQMDVAAQSVKAVIKRLIQSENPQKPLSDEKLVKMLDEEGITIARRTVAKYREALGIGSSSQRRLRPTW